jgi:hypothetical protein
MILTLVWEREGVENVREMETTMEYFGSPKAVAFWKYVRGLTSNGRRWSKRFAIQTRTAGEVSVELPLNHRKKKAGNTRSLRDPKRHTSIWKWGSWNFQIIIHLVQVVSLSTFFLFSKHHEIFVFYKSCSSFERPSLLSVSATLSRESWWCPAFALKSCRSRQPFHCRRQEHPAGTQV